MKALAIIGVPGTGKTTLVKEFIKRSSDDWEIVNPAPQVFSTYSKKMNLHVLGKYEEGEIYAGTDKLGLSCQPHIQKWLSELEETNVLLEGDRLSNGSFFDFLIEKTKENTEIYVLETSKEELIQRYLKRGSNQSTTFIKGRETKVSNISGNITYMDIIKRYNHMSESDLEIILKDMFNYFNIS
jgi:dephospho-CoA kinase